MSKTLPSILDFASVRGLYRENLLTPRELIEEVVQRIRSYPDRAVFITTLEEQALVAADDLVARCPNPDHLPLWGLPFAVKDNIDVAGVPTTAGCPDYAYLPTSDATVVERLRAAGAILVGKTNLDQFATGLNGTRSPYGAPRSVFDPDRVSGGSSSGSAVAVAAGLVSFALGTDTAGSGRVPAAFNNIVGIKPTPGLVPSTGVVPACRSVDCVTLLAATTGDGVRARRVMEGVDPSDPYSRLISARALPSARMRLGVLAPKDREFFGNTDFEALYRASLGQASDLGHTLVEVDYAPFQEVARLLYEGPWVAERYAAVGAFVRDHSDAVDPTVRAIVLAAGQRSAAEAFEGQYRLRTLRQLVDVVWTGIDALMLPTVPTSATVAEMLADPVRLNSRFGYYTNFVNLLGYAAIAVPSGLTHCGLASGVTVIGPEGTDDALAPLAAALHRATRCGTGVDTARVLPDDQLDPPDATNETIPLAIVGAHLSGMALNHQLTSAGARLLRSARTTPEYRLFELANTDPKKPGLVRSPGFDGPGIDVEVWAFPATEFGRFVDGIPAPLGIGHILLDSGDEVCGFLCEGHAIESAAEITAYGGWRAYLKCVAGIG